MPNRAVLHSPLFPALQSQAVGQGVPALAPPPHSSVCAVLFLNHQRLTQRPL